MYSHAMPLDLRDADPVALIAAVMAPNAAELDRASQCLAERLGPIRDRGPIYAFDFTMYYETEMGPGLVKQLIWFDRLVGAEELAWIKRATMVVERDLATPGKEGLQRRANIDPGLVSADSLVLATTKYAGHRICIARGLWAEITLRYERGEYARLPWTYADYCTEAAQAFLQAIRRHLLRRVGMDRRTSGDGLSS